MRINPPSSEGPYKQKDNGQVNNTQLKKTSDKVKQFAPIHLTYDKKLSSSRISSPPKDSKVVKGLLPF